MKKFRDSKSGGEGRPPFRPRSEGSSEFKPRRNFARDGESAGGEFKPRRSFGGEGGGEFKSRRSFGGEGGEFKPRRSFGGEGGGEFKPRRSFGGEGGGEFKQRRSFGGEGGGEFKPRRSFGGEGGGEFKPRRSFGGEGGGEFKPRRSFGGEGGGEFKPRRSFGGEGGGGEFKPRRSFGGEGGGGEFKPRRSFGGEGGGEFKPRRQFSDDAKPFGRTEAVPRAKSFRSRAAEGDSDGRIGLRRDERPRDEGFRSRPRGEGRDFGARARSEDRGFAERPRKPWDDRGASNATSDAGEKAYWRHESLPQADAHDFVGADQQQDAQSADHHSGFDPGEQRRAEFRVCGVNAVLKLFATRPEALRKVWYSHERKRELAALLAHCAEQRIGFDEVESEELVRVSGSEHHEGVCIAILKPEQLNFGTWLAALPQGRQLVLLLDGVGNPHNLGALLRTAAHFDVAAVLLTPGSAELSGAVYRTAEGGAEAQPLIVLDSLSNLAELSAQGFSLVCAEMQGGSSSFAPGALPDRCVLILGAEPTGVSTALRTVADSSISIPGSGKVESLNVAAAGAILLAAWHR